MSPVKTGVFLIALTFQTSSILAEEAGSSTSLATNCPRPPVGSVLGACAIRNDRASGKLIDNEASPYVMHKYESCLMTSKGLPSGGLSDANFLSDFTQEWRTEIQANIENLRKLLSSKDKLELDKEQRGWIARKDKPLHPKGSRRANRGEYFEGSSSKIHEAISDESTYASRAIELACRVDILTKETPSAAKESGPENASEKGKTQ